MSVNVKPLSELCKLTILGSEPSPGQGVNDGLIKLILTRHARQRPIFGDPGGA